MNSMLAAERILYSVSPTGVGQELTVSVGVPVETRNRGWGSEVSTGFIDPVLTIYGMDAWQAVQESMLFISRRVADYEEKGWKFYWEKDGERIYAADLAFDPNLVNRERR